MKRLFFFLLLLCFWLKAAGSVQAFVSEPWRSAGSPDEHWTAGEDWVTGYSQHHFTDSYLVSDPAFLSVPQDFLFRFRFTPVQGTDHNFVWNYQDELNYYQAHFNGGAVWISRFINGQEMLSVGKSFATALGETYMVAVRQLGNRITLSIDGAEIASFDDLTHDVFSSGSVGFKLSPGAVIPVETRFEQILVHDALVTLLPVGLMRQNNPDWAETEYDTAGEWSFPDPPGISRWGCALTSLVMIFQYHGLTMMPDGQPVNPLTVNSWLKDQSDGYVGQGLVNWFAATRLAGEISDRYSVSGGELPKLEFSYQSLSWREIAETEILSGRPFIAQVPGHFTPVHGFDQRTGGFLIQDPLYDFQYLSQHGPVQSLRLFRPSQTDLSALAVIHRPEITVQITDHSGTEIEKSWEESITPQGGETSDPWMFTAVFQPADGVYQLTLNGVSHPDEVRVFVYDERAHFTVLPLPAEFAGETLFVQFAKTGESVWTAAPENPPTAEFSWEFFLAELESLRAQGKLSVSVTERLKTLAQFGRSAEEHVQSRYVSFLFTLMERYEYEGEASAEKILPLRELLQQFTTHPAEDS